MKSKLIFITGVLSLALLISFTAQADDEATGGDKPSFSATQKVQLTTVVEAIDHETRQITLRGPEGNSKTITASEEARNLEQIEAGDQVGVEYVQHMSIEVQANDGMQPGSGVITGVARAPEGENPGAMHTATSITTATVEEINLETNTFKLKWPGGEIKEYEARDPDNLKKAAVGDLVVTTYTEAIAVFLVEIPAE
jgi:Cu/Ag efflux protein CusF